MSLANVRHLEWARELEARAHARTVPEAMRAAIAAGDFDTAGFMLGAEHRASEAAERLSAGPGLVSVLTTQTRPPHAPRIPFRVKAEQTDVRNRGDMFELDAASRRLSRLRMAVGFGARAHLVADEAGPTDRTIMVTLTYAGTNDAWRPNHIRAFMDVVRHWHKRQGLKCRYVWVAELQKRGVIHYHVALFLPADRRMPKPDEAGWWPHGMTRVETARAAVPYLLKYLSKDTSKTFGSFPHGARIYGMGGLDHASRRARRWLGLPAFVQGNSDCLDDWRRAPGGGWTSPDGECVPSEFRTVWQNGRVLQRIHRHARVIEAAGPFSWIHRSPHHRHQRPPAVPIPGGSPRSGAEGIGHGWTDAGATASHAGNAPNH